MPERPAALFLPGFAAPSALYDPGLPPGWSTLRPPPFARAAQFDDLRAWAVHELRAARSPVFLAGHSLGGALALAAAANAPDRVAGLVLVSPAGLPLQKPIHRSLGDFARQLVAGLYPLRQVGAAVLEVARAPKAALRLAHAVHSLDLTAEMRAVRASGIPATVVGCATDTLVTATHCRQTARLLGARYRELTLAGGHMWMLGAWPAFAAELAACSSEHA